MTYDSNNIFAKIIRGEAPCFKVYENNHSLAFMDIMPQAEGHTLVIPKEPAQDIFDLSSEGAAALIKTTQLIATAVKKVTNSPGMMIVQLSGAAAGQTVFHVHFHVIPRSSGLDMKLHARETADFTKLKLLADKIKSAIEQGQ